MTVQVRVLVSPQARLITTTMKKKDYDTWSLVLALVAIGLAALSILLSLIVWLH